MAKQKDFDDFLTNIEPSKSTVDYISSVQNTLREFLKKHSKYKDILIDTFLSGSYAKHTSIRPVSGDSKRDVDIVVVTNHLYDDDSSEVLEELSDVLKENKDYKNVKVQSSSVSVELTGISVDVVPVIEHGIYNDVYYVGSSEDGSWRITDPKGHKKWSTEVNQNNENKYKPLVKIFKWWRRENCPKDIKYPKGITLEKIVSDNIGDATLSTEDLLIGTMQNIVNNYKDQYVSNSTIPYIHDPSDYVSDNNLLAKYKFNDFKEFVEKIEEHLGKLNENGTTNEAWREILGNQFPSGNTSMMTLYSQTSCLSVSHREKPAWPMNRHGAVFVSAKVKDWDGNISNYESDSYPIEKHCEIVYTASYNSCKRYRMFWQIVNTGYEARDCLRGGYEISNAGVNSRREVTLYKGKHYVQCFIIDGKGNCVARSKEFFINVK